MTDLERYFSRDPEKERLIRLRAEEERFWQDLEDEETDIVARLTRQDLGAMIESLKNLQVHENGEEEK